MFGKSVEKKENRGVVMCFLVAVYTITSIVFVNFQRFSTPYPEVA